MKGEQVPDISDKFIFDSNCITPGTPFMKRVADYLQFYVAERINTDPGWRDVCYYIVVVNVIAMLL